MTFGDPHGFTVEIAHLGGEMHRLILRAEGVELKIDIKQNAVFALLNESLDACVAQIDEQDKCPFCCANTDHTSDCCLIETLRDGLAEARRLAP